MSLSQELTLLGWVCLSVWYYGYHISELNFPQPSLTCSSATSTSSIPLGLPNCLDLTSALYSLATAVFTVGGLVGSLFSAMIIEQTGMLGAIKLTGWVNLLSSVAMTLAPHWTVLVVGRFGGGIASGLGITLVPPLLSTIAKTSHHKMLSSHSGAIGILNQVGITVGIVCGQAAGLVATGVKGDKQGAWRWVVLVSGAAAVVQVVGGMWVANDAVDKRQHDAVDDGLIAEAGGEGDDIDQPNNDGETSPLVGKSAKGEPPVPVASLLSSPPLRPQVLLICGILAVQQLSGINACLFYSSSILQSLLPASAGLISIGISVVNLVMTFPSIVLIDVSGHLLQLATFNHRQLITPA